MKKIIISGIIAGVVLLVFSVVGLYLTIFLFPDLALQYYNPAFNEGSGRYLLYFIHPFIISMALAWFWERFKGVLSGSFITRGIEFGVIYALIAIFPMLWLVFSAMSVSMAIVASWLVFGLLQGVIAGLICEKVNP